MAALSSSHRILVLDDDALIQARMTDLLQGRGHEILGARTLREAEALLERAPLMAFVDFNLGSETGDDFVRAVRASPRHWKLPTVMVTAIDRQEVVRRCFVAGADDFISKPVREEVVFQKVDAVIAGMGVAPRIPSLPRTVLVASANEVAATLVVRLLEASGFTAVRARDPGEGALLAESRAVDVAVLDLSLPGEGAGLVAAALARAVKPPPILAIARGALPLAGTFSWQPLAIYDAELELEHLIKHLSTLVTGSISRAERRQKPRVPFASVVRFRFYGHTEWQIGYGYDLSETGIFVRSLTPIPASQPVEVQFRLAEDGKLLEARGLSIWTNAYQPRDLFSFPYGMGIAFAEFPIDEWTRVHEYVQHRVGQRQRR